MKIFEIELAMIIPMIWEKDKKQLWEKVSFQKKPLAGGARTYHGCDDDDDDDVDGDDDDDGDGDEETLDNNQDWLARRMLCCSPCENVRRS